MEILASCSIEESERYNGKLVIPCEDKKTPNKVSLNIVVDDGNTEVFKRLSGNERCITFVGEPTNFCPTELQGKVFNETTIDDLMNIPFPTNIEGVTTLVRLPKDFPNDQVNMRSLLMWSKQYPEVRFIGGKILGIDGVKVGRYDKGKDKMSPVYDEMYDTFLEVDLNHLDGIQEVIKRNKKKISSVKGSGKKKSKEKKPSRRKVAFSNLFGEGVEEF